MTTILQIDSSARNGSSKEERHGSHTRRLTRHFVEHWLNASPDTRVIYRDIGNRPPGFVTSQWIHAAFTPEAAREPWMHRVLAESDALVDELIGADVIVLGLPMYNFGMPAQCKAYIDNIVRVGRTFGFDRSRGAVPYWPMLAEMEKTVVTLGSSGDTGYQPDGPLAHMNHVEPAVLTALGYIGITRHYGTNVEYDEFGGENLQASLRKAESEAERIADLLLGKPLPEAENKPGPRQALSPA